MLIKTKFRAKFSTYWNYENLLTFFSFSNEVPCTTRLTKGLTRSKLGKTARLSVDPVDLITVEDHDHELNIYDPQKKERVAIEMLLLNKEKSWHYVSAKTRIRFVYLTDSCVRLDVVSGECI